MFNCGRICLLVAWALIVPGPAAATTALYSLSYGARSAGMAGATLASGGEALNQFLNPANLSFLPKRLDINITYLRSNLRFRNELNDTQNGRDFAGFPLSDNNFLIPAIGLAYPLEGTDWAFGFQLYGLGGDAARFSLDDFEPPAGFGQDQRFRGNLILITFGPSVAYKVTDKLSLGATPQVTAGRLKLDQPFGTFAPPTSARFRFRFNMDDYGFHYAFGGRLSATYRVADWLTAAVAYQTPREFNFDGEVRLTFPEGTGSDQVETHGTIPFTLPHQVDTGLALRPVPKLLVEIGFSWIGWSAEDPFQTFKVNLDTPPEGFPSTLAAPIKWDDQYIYRIGTAYELTSALTIRAGYSYASNPVSAPGAFLTFPAYGFQTLAVGMTWELTENWDISLAFERAFPISVKTRTSTTDAFHANSQEDHNQYSAQLQLGWSF